jgi:hypothetical protein
MGIRPTSRHYYLRLGGKIEAVKAPTARQAIIYALQQWTDEDFDALPRSEGNQRLTLSIVECDPAEIRGGIQ